MGIIWGMSLMIRSRPAPLNFPHSTLMFQSTSRMEINLSDIFTQYKQIHYLIPASCVGFLWEDHYDTIIMVSRVMGNGRDVSLLLDKQFTAKAFWPVKHPIALPQ